MRTMLKMLCALAFLCASAGVEGQTTWAVLSGLKVGQKIQIIEMNSKKHSGTFLSASDSAITFTEGSAEKSIQKADVRRVKLVTYRRMRNSLIGFGAGAGAGAAIGAAMCAHDTWVGPGGCAAVIGGFGAIVGTPIGALMPTDSTIYVADSRKPQKP